MAEKNYSPTIINRKAKFEYTFLEKFEVGIVLKGTEIKSIREGKVNLSEAFCYFKDGELFIKDMHISPYTHGNIHNPQDPARDRKLLMKKRELERLDAKKSEQGLTIVPTKLFFSERGICKLEIALAQGKKLYDKRDTIKQRDQEREMKRNY